MDKTSTDLEQLYEKPGKRQFTRLVLDVAAHDECRTMGLFWGGGGDSRLAAAAGFDVLAVDKNGLLAEAMAEDGQRFGYATFSGNARQIRESRDVWHPDFMDTPNPDNFRTIRHLSKHTRKWLAVTVATDHIKNPEMQGESLMATLPAWLTFAAEGFTLEYFAWYRRNDRGLRMWTALLERRTGKGTHHQVLPVQIAYSIGERGYWSSRRFYERGLLAHRYAPENDHEKMTARRYYEANRDKRLSQSRAAYRKRCADPVLVERDRRRSADWNKSAEGLAWRREWDAKRRQDPEYRAKAKAYHREWYLKKKAAVSGTAAEAVKD